MAPMKTSITFLAFLVQAALAAAQDAAAPPDQWEAYTAPRAKTILELQPFRSAQTATPPSGEAVTLINLNPTTDASFLLRVGNETYHIDNPEPATRQLALTREAVLEITGAGNPLTCALAASDRPLLQGARDSGLPFAPLCRGRLFPRNSVSGSRSSL